MKTTCPNCGAPIEFRYDDSFVRVCSHCNNAVLRTDRGVDSLGKVADLVPMDSPLKLFAEGHFGSTTFLLVGMAQIRHQAGGMWQEWYAKFDGGRWGWLAEAQGRYYMTFEEPWIAAPANVTVGERLQIPLRGKPHDVTVAEVTSAQYVAAAGELPFKLVPNGAFRYADMSDGAGTFATLDYDDGSGPPTLYVGAQVPLADMRITGGEVMPTREPEIKSTRLACPNCNAPIDIRVPGESLRVVCAHCNSIADASQGALQILGQLAQRATPRIPLGSVGAFSEGDFTVVGYVQRSAEVEGEWWPFEEYLLYRPGVGFRWLVESDGHWSYVQPIALGAVEATVNGAKYDGVGFRRYQQSPLRVDAVLGEFYWQVQQGETVESEDLIAPPAMLSRETSQTEENWSLGTYMREKDVQHAFGNKELPLGSGVGIAPNQPDVWSAASGVMSLGFLALIALGLVFAMAARDEQKFHREVQIPAVAAAVAPAVPEPPSAVADATTIPECIEYKKLLDLSDNCTAMKDSRDTLKQLYIAATATSSREVLVSTCQAGIDSIRVMTSDCQFPSHDALMAAGSGAGSADAGAGSADANAYFSDPIQIDGGRNIQIVFEAPTLDNNWVGVTADLVEEATGSVVTLDGNLEHYSGFEDGESWSEGSRETREVVGPQHAGTYILRVEGAQGGAAPLPIQVTVRQGVFRFRYLAWAMVILGIPLLLIGAVSWSHEKKRWENANAGKAPVTPVTILVVTLGGLFVAIGFLIKAMAESSSSDD